MTAINAESPTTIAGAPLWVPLAEVRPGLNARGHVGDIDGLAMSIQAIGQQQPLLVEPHPQGGYVVYDGHRRYAALCKLRAKTVKVVVQAPITGTDRAIRQVAMHAQGKPFDPIAECDAIHALFWDRNLALEQIARIVGHSPAWVRDRLALRNLTEGEKTRVRDGRLPLNEAMGIVRERRAERDGKPGAPGAAGKPAHFGESHPLARAAGKLCRRQRHQAKVLGKVACGACWEAAIRADERSAGAA